MTSFFKGKAVSQVDEFLCEGKMYSVKQLCKIIRDNKDKFEKQKKVKG